MCRIRTDDGGPVHCWTRSGSSQSLSVTWPATSRLCPAFDRRRHDLSSVGLAASFRLPRRQHTADVGADDLAFGRRLRPSNTSVVGLLSECSGGRCDRDPATMPASVRTVMCHLSLGRCAQAMRRSMRPQYPRRARLAESPRFRSNRLEKVGGRADFRISLPRFAPAVLGTIIACDACNRITGALVHPRGGDGVRRRDDDTRRAESLRRLQ